MDTNSVELLNKDPQYIEKCNEYMQYIETHKNNVLYAYNTYFKNRMNYVFDNINNELNTKIIDILDKQIPNHDNSKYTDDEFYAYRVHFYPTDLEKEKMMNDDEYDKLCDLSFDEAVKHHVMNNSHHPEFYHYNKVPIVDDYIVAAYHPYKNEKYNPDEVDMGICDIIEMICDWISMSIHYKNENNCYIGWYTSNSSIDERNAMSVKTKMIVEKITSKIFPNEYELSDSPIWLLKNKE